MLFQTPVFFAFFGIVFAAYWALRHDLHRQNIMLLVASYVFYGWWDVRFLVLIVGGTAFAYVMAPAVAGERITRRQMAEGGALGLAGGLVSFVPHLGRDWRYLLLVVAVIAASGMLATLLNRLPADRRGRPALIAGIIANLVLLGFFKYFNFFAESFVNIADQFGGDVTWTTTNIVLPIGISFFTFQKIAYLVDVKRKHFAPSKSLLTFASFVAFFPQLVAGPIERAPHLYGQFLAPRRITREGLTSGAMLFFWGMYKKVVVADNLAPIVNAVFARADTATTGELLVGIIAFAFQIYGDFSGYTDMARGVARMLGFNLMLNFNLPYFSRTPSEFWLRWHISLSSWLRDYLYVALGGNRGGTLLTYRNLFLTMLLGGLWHGASWTFVAWGAFHGFILIAYRIADIDRRVMPRVNAMMVGNPAAGLAANAVLVSIMSALTLIGWLFFRAPDMATAGEYLAGLFSGFDFASADWGRLALAIVPLLLVQCWQRWTNNLEFLIASTGFIRLNLMLFIGLSLLFLAPSGTADFIYFAF